MSLSKEAMIEELVQVHGYTSDSFEGMDDKAVLEIYESVHAEEQGVDNSEFEFEEMSDPTDTVATNEQVVPPLPTSPEWNDYVLGHLVPEEQQDGKPNVDGLRRLVELLVGPILVSTSNVLQVPSPANGWTATVVHTIEMGGRHSGDDLRVYSGSADANADNTDAPYSKYPTAIAETRAEARALRRILRLRGASAEEVSAVASKGVVNKDKEEPVGPINDNQLAVIDMLSNTTRGMNINVGALAKSLFPKYNSVKRLTSEQGIQLISELNKYQRASEPGYVSVPVDLINYEEDWRNG